MGSGIVLPNNLGTATTEGTMRCQPLRVRGSRLVGLFGSSPNCTGLGGYPGGRVRCQPQEGAEGPMAVQDEYHINPPPSEPADPRRDSHGVFVVETIEDLGPILTLIVKSIERVDRKLDTHTHGSDGHVAAASEDGGGAAPAPDGIPREVFERMRR